MRLSHAEAQALVSARLDGPLDPVAERELNAHLATCDSCRAFNLSATQLARGLQGMPRMAPSPAVTRAVLEHVSTPRSGLGSLFGGLPQNALPIASAVAAAVIVLFIGAFGVMRLLDDDEPNVIPALTEPTFEGNLAQQPRPTDEPAVTTSAEQTVTEDGQGAETAPADDSSDGRDAEEPAPTVEAAGQQGVDEQSTEVSLETEPAQETAPADEGQGAAAQTVPSDVSTENVATEEGSEANQRLLIGETESTPDEETPETVGTETGTEPTLEEAASEPTAGAEGVDDTSPVAEIGPSGQSTTRPAETEAPATVAPTATSEPTATPEATAEPTSEPTVEPSPTSEPTVEPTAEPTVEPAVEPSPTPEPTPEPSPTPEPTVSQGMIVPREGETPVGGDVTPELDDGTGAAVTEETESEPQIEPSGQTDATGDDGEAQPTIEPAGGDSIIGPPGDEGDGTESAELPSDTSPATAEVVEQPEDGGQNGVGSAGVTLGTAPEVQDLADVPGDPGASGARLGLDANGQLIYGTNPGRVSLEQNGIVLRGIDAELGQAVGACDANGECADVSTGSKGDEFTTDTPIGWVGDLAVYERLLGDDSVEFRAVSIDPGSRQPIEDISLGDGPWDWFTIVRPYPSNGGLLVPTLNYWLLITQDGVTEITGNPAQQAVEQIRLKPDQGLIAYSTGGTIYVALLDAPGDATAQIPYPGFDYDLSPDGTQVAILSGDGIAIYDLAGNLVTTIPNPEGLAVGSLTWLNDGIFFSDLTNGVLRVVQP